jgi:signal peptidase
VSQEADGGFSVKEHLKEIVGILAVVSVIIILMGSLWAYSGVWPPLVVVESESMQHSDDTSYIGVIDTGDLVMVKETSGFDDVVTYVKGSNTGYATYGDYGDVIIYRPYGMDVTPIIHRPLLMIYANQTSHSFDIPDLALLPEGSWDLLGEEDRWWDITGTVELHDIGHADVTVRMDFGKMIASMDTRNVQLHGGLVTMGDNNWYTEDGERYGIWDQFAICQEPIQEEWIVGKARGELPWFGLLKLWFAGGAPENVPENSKTNLFVTLFLIVAIPISLDVLSYTLRKRKFERSSRGKDGVKVTFRKLKGNR